MPLELTDTDTDFAERFDRLVDDRRQSDEDVRDTVAAILADVRDRGDAAVVDYTRRFDRFDTTIGNLRLPADALAAAEAECDSDDLAAMTLAAERIRAFHDRQRPDDLSYTDDAGVRLGYRWTPVAAAGIYVPGGLASYPSSVLMNAIPARVAGVERIAMTVPAPDGKLSPLTLAAARLAGVDEVWRIGGAQAVAALAFGTASIAPVDKIVGPGNAYVAEAKRQVFGRVGIDSVAGPSEILVLADGDNDPEWIAADLLSQAEHGTDAQAILITDDAAFAGRVRRAVSEALQHLPRADVAGESWDRHGAIIVVQALDDAIALIDRLAPEHLELAVADPEAIAGRVRNAGAIFLGAHSPEAVGDYVAGPNHVLPTSRTARHASGLSVLDFMKRTTMIGCSAEALARIGPAAATLADAEGLQAHALSIRRRLGR